MREIAYQYSKYAFVGVVVALISIGIRELVGTLLPSDTPGYYTFSIFVAYLCGFILSYLGHKYISFSHVGELAYNHARSMAAFLLIALLGMLTALLVSLVVRYLLPTDKFFGDYAASLAFAVGVLVSSIVTFGMNRTYTFRRS